MAKDRTYSNCDRLTTSLRNRCAIRARLAPIGENPASSWEKKADIAGYRGLARTMLSRPGRWEVEQLSRRGKRRKVYVWTGVEDESVTTSNRDHWMGVIDRMFELAAAKRTE